MNEVTIGCPRPDEYSPYYAGYIESVQNADILCALRDQLDELLGFLGHLDPATGEHRYAPGKWSVKEVIGHVIDSERIFAYRALAFARGERQPLPGFEQDEYVGSGDFGHRSLRSLGEEFEHVRRSNLALFASFGESTWVRRGMANGSSLSVRAIAYVLAGHAAHHIQVIRHRYLETD
jgi:hypothetical protein